MNTSFPDIRTEERTFLDNHRGPFKFNVTRPHRSKPNTFTSEWLEGLVDRDDVEEEARALLDDPRDTIIGVDVWSTKEQQFIGGFK